MPATKTRPRPAAIRKPKVRERPASREAGRSPATKADATIRAELEACHGRELPDGRFDFGDGYDLSRVQFVDAINAGRALGIPTLEVIAECKRRDAMARAMLGNPVSRAALEREAREVGMSVEDVACARAGDAPGHRADLLIRKHVDEITPIGFGRFHLAGGLEVDRQGMRETIAELRVKARAAGMPPVLPREKWWHLLRVMNDNAAGLSVEDIHSLARMQKADAIKALKRFAELGWATKTGPLWKIEDDGREAYSRWFDCAFRA